MLCLITNVYPSMLCVHLVSVNNFIPRSFASTLCLRLVCADLLSVEMEHTIHC